MYVMFLLRPFTVHNVFPCFYGPNTVIIIIIIIWVDCYRVCQTVPLRTSRLGKAVTNRYVLAPVLHQRPAFQPDQHITYVFGVVWHEMAFLIVHYEVTWLGSDSPSRTDCHSVSLRFVNSLMVKSLTIVAPRNSSPKNWRSRYVSNTAFAKHTLRRVAPISLPFRAIH